MPHYKVYRHYAEGRPELIGGIPIKPGYRAKQTAHKTAMESWPVRPGGFLQLDAVRTAKERRWVEQSWTEKQAADKEFREVMERILV